MNKNKRNTNKNGTHLTKICSINECKCILNDTAILKAFDLVASMDITMLTTFNKIYKFDQNYELIKNILENYLNKSNQIDKGIIINTLKLNGKYSLNYDDVNFFFNIFIVYF